MSAGPESESGSSRNEVEPRDDLERLRALLLASDRDRLAGVESRLDALHLDPEELAELLPEAVARRSGRDHSLARALAPTLERGLEEQIARNPGRVAEAIYPVLGPAIRRAIGDALAGFVETLNRAIEYSFSWRGLRWRLEALRSGVPFAQVVLKHALLYRVEQVFLVHTETGLLLAHAAAEEEMARDADLVSGMLTAIRDFVGDSFEGGERGALRGVSVGELTLFVETGPRAMLAVAVRGQVPPTLRERWQAVLETVHLRYAEALQQFEGDATPFETARPLLEECLETVLETRRGGERTAVRVVWIGAAAVLLLLAGWWLRGWWRVRQALHDLDARPGIVVLDGGRRLGARVHGLLDVDAEDPDTILAAHGLAPGSVAQRWEPFLSTEPAVVLARARRLLQPPSGVELVLDGDTLHAAGTASPAWVAATRRLGPAIAGVSAMDLSSISMATPPALVDARRRVEEPLVLFGIGSAELDPAARSVLAEVAASYRDLERLAAELGYRARLAIIGRTDELGAREFNRRLSGDRAEAVRTGLSELGVSTERMSAQGIGNDQPLLAAAAEARSQRNRSVSFELELTPADGPEASR